MKNQQLAVLMTCHNRRDTTLSCLQTLYQQKNLFDVYLVDDGSVDGTTEAVNQKYPEVKTLKGNGQLFWGGGMRLAFATAMQREYEYYLWLNDDTFLNPDAISKLLATHQLLTQRGDSKSIVVGSVTDPVTGELTYGGRIPSKRLLSFKFDSIAPGTEPQTCSTMQGNCVLIPRSVAEIVGNIDPAFIHTMGDLDYGLRARQLGCSVWITAGYVGTCSKNSATNSWADANLTAFERLNKALQPKAFPIKSRAIYARRHKGTFWMFHWLLPYVRAVIGYRKIDASAFKKSQG